jgi:hypothetical protein
MNGIERQLSGNKWRRETNGDVLEPKPRRAEGKEEDIGKAWDAVTATLCVIFYRT